MVTNDIQPGSLYLTYDSFRHLLHASLSQEGTNGFLRYMRDDLTYIIQEGHNPNVWLTHYQFPDRRRIPQIRQMQNSSYLDIIAEAAERYGGRCLHTINAGDAIYCMEKGIVPLTPASERGVLAQNPDYPEPAKGFENIIPRTNVILPEYRSYTALQTEKGIVLFTVSPEGDRQRKAYEKHLELNFFNPSQPGGKLRYWEIIADPHAVQDKVDKLAEITQNSDSKIAEAFADETLLGQGRSRHEYDLTPNDENYNIFRRRKDPWETPAKRISDLTIKELWRYLTTRNPGKESGMVCIESRAFPGEDTEAIFRMKR